MYVNSIFIIKIENNGLCHIPNNFVILFIYLSNANK